jgi:hypothetical protein
MATERIKKRTSYRACSCCSNTVVGKGGGGGDMVGNRTGARAELQIRLDDWSNRVCSVATPESIWRLQNQSGGSRINLIWRLNLNLTRSFGDSDDFSIWSSSRSAVASNLHALPYKVVVLELLAPEYSGGLDLYLQIQNQSGALRDHAFVKYGDSTYVHNPHTAPVRYIWYPSYSCNYSLSAYARRAWRDTGDGVEGLNRLDWRLAGVGDSIVLRH